MVFETSRLCGSKVTKIAFEWAITGMDSLMFFEIRRVGSSEFTMLAFIRFFRTMN